MKGISARFVIIAFLGACSWVEPQTQPSTVVATVANPLFFNNEYMSANGWSFYSSLVADTFPEGQVFRIREGKRGTIWFATHDGVMSFNGADWQFYSSSEIKGVEVKDIAFDHSRQILWVATINGGLSYFDGASWEALKSNDSRLYSSVIEAIDVSEEGELWGGMTDRVFRFDGKNWTFYSCKDNVICGTVSDITVSPGGKVWVATEEGIYEYDGKTWRTYSLDYGFSGDDGVFRRDPIRGISSASDGSVWLISDSGGIVTHIDGDEWTNYTVSGIPLSIFASPNGTVWVGTMDSFVLGRFDGREWVSFDGHPLSYFLGHDRPSYSELPFRGVLDIYQDTDGHLWLATEIGVFRQETP